MRIQHKNQWHLNQQVLYITCPFDKILNDNQISITSAANNINKTIVISSLTGSTKTKFDGLFFNHSLRIYPVYLNSTTKQLQKMLLKCLWKSINPILHIVASKIIKCIKICYCQLRKVCYGHRKTRCVFFMHGPV